MNIIKYIFNAFKFTKRVLKHKYWVGKYCFKAGLYWRGITHDLSKFSPTEFFESCKYYIEGDSPINVSKKIHGWSRCWFHHRGNNLHHYEAWMDKFDSGGVALPMPYKYAAEMLCDYVGAAKVYFGKDFSYEKEWEWWQKKREHCAMNEKTKAFIEQVLYVLYLGEKQPETLAEMYFVTVEEWENDTFKRLYDYWTMSGNSEDDLKHFNERTLKY